jgi:phosphatidylinositol alpha-1,6-mannosyltransferase
VIPLGVDFDKFRKCAWGPPKRQGKTVLTVGAIKYRKGIHISLEAMKRVIERIPDVRYEIVGRIVDRSLYVCLRQFVDRNGLQKKVAFLGKVNEEELLARYQNCDVFLLTPVNQGLHFEGFGLVYLEANACGKPVVASKGCGAEEPVIDGYNGLLVPQADPDATAEAVEYLLRNPIVAARMGRNGMARARELRWEEIAARVLKVYTKTLG